MGFTEFACGLNSFRIPSNESNISDNLLIARIRQSMANEKPSKKDRKFNWDHGNEERKKVQKPGKQVVPLSAYSCYNEKPFLIDGQNGHGVQLNNFIDRAKLNSIRNLGYHTLRPIGIGKTMKEMQQELKCKEENMRDKHGTSNVVNDLPLATARAAISLPHSGEEVYSAEEESDQSYDIGEDYDNFEGQATLEETDRGTYVEHSQLIDTSFSNRTGIVGNSMRTRVNENEESVEEIPSLTISDTADLRLHGSRTSSLTARLTEAMNDEL